MKGNEELRCEVGSIIAGHCPMRDQVDDCKYAGPSGCSDCSYHWCIVAGYGLEVVKVSRGNYKNAKKRIADLEKQLEVCEDRVTVSLDMGRDTAMRVLRELKEKLEYKMNTIEVKCSKCGSVHNVPAGQLTQEGIDNYVCEVCSEQVLERRVEDMENRKGGRTLLTEG